MIPDADVSQSQEQRLQEVIADYLREREAGRNPDQSELLARHPDLAGELQEFFSGQEQFGRLAAPLRQAIEPAADAEVSGALGDFRIVREVGRGGMGIVYEAEQISLHRRVALKVLPFAATMDPRHLQRFHNEAQAAACLHHGNIVPVYFVGCERGVHFYAMQFIDGQPLSEVIHQLRGREKNDGKATAEEQTTAYQPPDDAIAAGSTIRRAADATPLTVEGRRSRAFFRKVAELGVQAAEALDHAHQVGIVHRDIKPANLLVDDRGNLWVTDFGLAQMQSDTRLTRTGDLVGTLRYMSPEQALAKRVVIDHRTDIYSLGATLYELLTLQPAFTGQDREELLRQIAFEESKRPRQVERAIPAELETIVQKAMEKRPQDRYGTAHELADDLERWLRNEPIHARRPTLLQYTSKWVRRHKPAATASAVVMLIALALASYLAWMQHDREVRQAARRSASAKVLRAALEDSRGWQAERRLPEALSAAQRAVGLLAGADVDEALRQQVQSRLADLQLLEKLENVRLERGSAVKDGYFDRGATDPLYGRLFREFGIDVEALSAEEAAERIRGTTVAVELASVLDEWSGARKAARRIDDPFRKTLLRIARLADPDPWRTKVREALERWDRQALRALASSENVSHFSPISLHVLGNALLDPERGLMVSGTGGGSGGNGRLDDEKAREATETFLRKAQRQYPNDFWLNTALTQLYPHMQPPRWEDAIRFGAVAVALRPGSPGSHLNLGVALRFKGRPDEAIAEFREVLRLKTDYADAHDCLGVALSDKGLLKEAIAEYEEAIRLNPDDPMAHNKLGTALDRQGQAEQAIAEYRKAIRLKGDFAEAHHNLAEILRRKGLLNESIAEYREGIRLKENFAGCHFGLGNSLLDKGRLDEAINEFQAAIRYDKNDPKAHLQLGLALAGKGHLDDAIAEYRAALQIKKDYVVAHNNLGNTLKLRGRPDEAMAEFREALRLDKDSAEPHCSLGLLLWEQGRFRDALLYLRRGHELGSRKTDWRHPSAQWLQDCERAAELDGKLPAILSGQKQPADTAERFNLAVMCQRPYKQLHVAAVRFYREMFADKPQLADDLNTQHRYNAACSAALAGCGRGKDADKLNMQERALLRQQALTWLRADLKAYRQLLEKSAGKASPTIAQRMQHWLHDSDFASVRGEKALEQLPKEERSAWRKLWADVAELLAQTRTTAASPKNPDAK